MEREPAGLAAGTADSHKAGAAPFRSMPGRAETRATSRSAVRHASRRDRLPAESDPAAVPTNDITQLLVELRDGRPDAADRLFEVVYSELYGIANRQMRSEGRAHTLQPTALVNEAYLRLFRSEERTWSGRDHFLGFASRAMRSILVDHARAKRREKRSAVGERISMDSVLLTYEARGRDLVALDEALERLGQMDERMVRLVELRFFGGQSMAEAARVLDMPLRSAEREWQTARAWLRKELDPS